MREPCPCHNCSERFIACSPRCPKDARGEYGYKAWKARLDAEKEANALQKSINRVAYRCNRASWVGSHKRCQNRGGL